MNYKISFCMVCMNRLHHLSQTLSQNILDNKDYENLELILLDYNSTDGLEQFIKQHMLHYVRGGRLVYCKTNEPQSFNRSHSRNLAMRLASGDILVNLDADNYTGKNFATYVNRQFNKSSRRFLAAVDSTKGTRDVLGRICVKKDDFLKIGGYDERMISYGFEDLDLVKRLKTTGLQSQPIDGNFLTAINHTQSERLKNEAIFSELSDLLLTYLSPVSTEFLFLYKNSQFQRGVLVDNLNYKFQSPVSALQTSQLKYEYSILCNSITTGHWKKDYRDYLLFRNGSSEEKLKKENVPLKFFSSTSKRYSFRITDGELIENAVMLFSEINNRMIMDQNALDSRSLVNEGVFGKGVIYRNFSKNPLTL